MKYDTAFKSISHEQRMTLRIRITPLFFSFVFFTFSLQGQVVDTTKILNVLSLEQQLDSVRAAMRTVDQDLQSMKLRLAEGTNIEEMLAVISGNEDYENLPEDQRSKRKRVDAVLRAITARPGQLRFNGGATSVLQWNPRSSNSFTSATGSVNIFAHTTIGSQTVLFMDIEAIGGNGPAAFVPSFAPMNGDAGSTQDADGLDRLYVNEAWMEFTAFQEALTVTAGKIDLTNYFDNNNVANDETAQFINGTFVNSAALPVSGNSAGLHLRTSIFHLFSLQMGFASVDNSGDYIADQLLKIGSAAVRIFPDSEHEGNIRIYGYLHPTVKNAGGFGLSADQNIAENVTLFGRVNHNSSPVARRFGISSAWSGGGRYLMSVSGHNLAFAMAYGESVPVSGSQQTEKTIESFVRYHINKWSHVSPHIQYVRGAAGLPVSLTIIGARMQFNF